MITKITEESGLAAFFAACAYVEATGESAKWDPTVRAWLAAAAGS